MKWWSEISVSINSYTHASWIIIQFELSSLWSISSFPVWSLMWQWQFEWPRRLLYCHSQKVIQVGRWNKWRLRLNILNRKVMYHSWWISIWWSGNGQAEWVRSRKINYRKQKFRWVRLYLNSEWISKIIFETALGRLLGACPACGNQFWSCWHQKLQLSCPWPQALFTFTSRRLEGMCAVARTLKPWSICRGAYSRNHEAKVFVTSPSEYPIKIMGSPESWSAGGLLDDPFYLHRDLRIAPSLLLPHNVPISGVHIVRFVRPSNSLFIKS